MASMKRIRASDKWHVPRYLTRKNCITTLSLAANLRKFSEELGNLRKPRKHFKTVFDEFIRILKIPENLLNFGKFRKQFKMV